MSILDRDSYAETLRGHLAHHLKVVTDCIYHGRGGTYMSDPDWHKSVVACIALLDGSKVFVMEDRVDEDQGEEDYIIQSRNGPDEDKPAIAVVTIYKDGRVPTIKM